MNLLPIGSVVTLKDASKSLMVIGVAQESEGKTYDYIGVPFPEGYISKEKLFLFNTESIVKISFIGFIDVEVQAFRGVLEESIKKSGAALPADAYFEKLGQLAQKE